MIYIYFIAPIIGVTLEKKHGIKKMMTTSNSNT